MPDLLNPDREFGLTLAAGQVVGPGTLVRVDGSGTGAVSGVTGPVHGFSLVSGAGTKTTGFPQRVLVKRQGILKVTGASFTDGATLYAGASGTIVASGSGVFSGKKIGYALDSDVAFVDLDLSNT